MKHAIHRAPIQVAMASHPGPRATLEDSLCAVRIALPGAMSNEVGGLFVLDGVGGQEGGEIASKSGAIYLATSFCAFLTGTAFSGTIDAEYVAGSVKRILVAANEHVLKTGRENELLHMASTVVAVVWLDDQLIVAWVGDSRAYRFHDDVLKCLTNDHRAVRDWLDFDLLGVEASEGPSTSNTITRYLGQREGFAPEARIVNASPRDMVLLCTDGLTDAVSDEDIAEWLRRYRAGELAFEDLPHRLVDASLAARTTDNVSVLCAERKPTEVPLYRHARTSVNGHRVVLANALGFQRQENGR